jgi:hypothetical protein
MELIYCNIFMLDNVRLNLEYNFSDEYEVRYNCENKSVVINRIDTNIPNDFFGINIELFNLVVGKNGSRKTTLMNILGLKEHDLRREYNRHNDKWLRIYKYEDSDEKVKFVIEGSDKELLRSEERVDSLKNFFSYEANYNFLLKRFENIHYLSNSLKKSMSVLYLITQNQNKLAAWVPDNNIGFDRDYIKYLFFENEIKVINSDYKFFTDNSKNENISYQIFLNSSEIDMYENRNGVNLNLYHSNNNYFNKNTIGNFFSPLFKEIINRDNKKRVIDFFTKKQVFSLLFLEQNIISLWNSFKIEIQNEGSFSDEKTVEWDNSFVQFLNGICPNLMDFKREMVDSIELDKEFDSLRNYLLNIYRSMVNFYLVETEQNDNENGFIVSIVDFLNKLDLIDKSFFSSNTLISVAVGNIKIDQNITDLLSVLDKYRYSDLHNDLNRFVDTSIPKLSEGQRELINIISKITSSVEAYKRSESILLLLDEPGVYLHPEWSRRLISYLVSVLNRRFPENKFSIIITTHSPFLLSDLPEKLILKITGDSHNLKVIRSDGGYGRNIYDILRDSFFLEAPVGKFAEEKIDRLLSKINNEEWLDASILENKINQEIDLIGDLIVKKK